MSNLRLQCGFNKLVACSVINTTTAATACNVTKQVFCNAIQKYNYPGYDHTTYTEAEKEACEYAPHACTVIAQNL